MAPSRTRSGPAVPKGVGKKPHLRRRSSICRRQDKGGDDSDTDGRFRFGFGNNNRDGNRDGDDDGDDDGGGRRGGFFRNRKGDGGGDGGRGRFRNGDGSRNRSGNGAGRNRNGNDGGESNSSTPGDPAETAPSSTSTLPASPDPTATEVVASSSVPVSTSAKASDTINPGVLLLQSAVTASPTSEANPTVTTSVPLMTPSEVGDSANLSGSGQYIESPDYSSGVESSVWSGPTPTPSPNAPPTGGPMGNDINGGGDGGAVNRFEMPIASMDPTAERILISVGSIGGFIVACFIVWMAWRSTKKSRKRGHESGRFGGLPRSFLSRTRFLSGRGWRTLDDTTDTTSPPPSYRGKPEITNVSSMEGFFRPDAVQQQQLSQQAWAQPPPDLAVATGLVPQQSNNNTYQPPTSPENTYNAANRPHVTLMTNLPPPYAHQPQQSFSSTNAAHFGAIMTDPPPSHTAGSSPVLQNGVSPISYRHHNQQQQPLLPQQFTHTHQFTTPIYHHHQPSRRSTSSLSSLSSGFGDVDGIYITDSLVAPPRPTTTALSPTAAAVPIPVHSHPPPSSSNNRRSTSTNSTGSSEGRRRRRSRTRRETVYTTTSEDRPARFRSVGSWVDQQTGRIRRAQQRGGAVAAQVPGNPGIPGIHNPPREQSFGMMMDDEEKPRRVGEVVAGLGRGSMV
ncbi:hypothetical protein N658DRAFT_17236 [Parathielavia hyrcaniae]|uniref:Uncharacterized protein n=1 Tax=Parathielavia hyrcaniae TaxID=113614 RepID=A0AAN6QA46_9PEZI|nr:hypothetical protein N658DRAFT_17236 [Parathielavia hyrcaniae]